MRSSRITAQQYEGEHALLHKGSIIMNSHSLSDFDVFLDPRICCAPRSVV